MPIKAGTLADAYDACVRDHFDYVYNLALLRSGDRALAQDISQEVFIRVYKGLPNFRHDAQLSTWIYRITMNVCHTILKRESTYRQKIDEADPGLPIHGTESPDPAELAMAESRKDQVRAAIQQLSPNQADVITLFYLKEHDYAEIAAILDMPMGTVKSHLHRAKQALKQILEGIIHEL